MNFHLIYRTLKRLALVLLISFAVPTLADDASVTSTTAAAAVQDSLLNLNTATAEELAEGLTQIGITKALAVIAWREAHGPFTEIEQLLEVRGIGERILALNRDRLRLE